MDFIAVSGFSPFLNLCPTRPTRFSFMPLSLVVGLESM